MERPLCTMLCEDCGKFGVMHEKAMTIFIVNSEFFAVARCVFCDRVSKDFLTKEDCIFLFWRNVKVFNFNTGEEVTDNYIIGKI